MDTIGQQIREARKQKGLTQEQLAEQVERNLRTIQRIENSENAPRNETLSLICEALEINLDDIPNGEKRAKITQITSLIITIFFLIILNFALATFVGYTNLRGLTTTAGNVAGFLLCFFIPHFIVQCTKEMNGAERLLKFGAGYLLYFSVIVVLMFFKENPWNAFLELIKTGFLICLILAMSVLYYGKQILKVLG